MKTLKEVLSFYSTPAALAGSEQLNREALRQTLDGLLQRYQSIMWIALAMTVALFIAEFIVGLTHIETPRILAGVGGAMGITVGGSIGVVRSIAREMAQTSLLIALVSELDRETLKPIINALAQSTLSK